ncbi:MAG: hypothetical protein LAP85_12765 [Acidobacteriia bacterium]|nr:hypothetical protein [Terriglobia bacterium]
MPTMILLVRNLPAMRSADPGISKAAADSCNAKISRLEAFDAAHDPVKKQTTRLSETEMNSYLAFVLSPHYNACLKSIRLKFEEGHLQGVAAVDFDRLQLNPTQLLTSLLRKMLTGVHTLTVRGILVSGTGKANFRLEEARFDSMTLPNLLVAEIITTVGRKQNPPFDPMQPSTLPYRIQKVDVHAGYIVVYQ